MDPYLEESGGNGGGAGVRFDSSPYFITGGEMRDYQVKGLNWLVNL